MCDVAMSRCRDVAKAGVMTRAMLRSMGTDEGWVVIRELVEAGLRDGVSVGLEI